MAPNDSTQIADEDRGPGAVRRNAARYALPVAVAGVAAATIGLVPALAASGDPELPKISAQQLIEKIAASDTEQLSGSVKITTDLGLPLDGLSGAADSFVPKGSGGGKDSSAAPGDKLMELSSGTHTLRVAADGPDKQRVSLKENAAEYSLIHNGGELWAYDSASNQAYHEASAKGASKDDKGGPSSKGKNPSVTPQEFAEQALKAAGDATSVSVDGTSRVAGRDAYQLVIKPKQAGSTVGSIKVAVDAETGTPLKFTLNPSSGGKAVVDVGFTKVDFAEPAASTFDFTPPNGAKVTRGEDSAKGGSDKPDAREERESPVIPSVPGGAAAFGGGDLKVIGKGWNAVYELKAPGGAGAPTSSKSKSGDQGMPAEAQGLIDSLGDKVSGKFGSGTVFQTRIVNALMTDDGKVYVGAVTKDALVKAADQAK